MASTAAMAEVKHAGSFDDEDAFNVDTDKLDARKIKVPCPHCRRVSAPLCSSKTEYLDGGWRWVGCDHREPYSTHKTVCRCGGAYTFTIYTPQ